MGKYLLFLIFTFFFPIQAHGQGPVIEHFDWEGRVEPETVIEAVNRFGDIRARRSRAGFVPISAVIQRHPSDETEPEIQVLPGEILRITVSYPHTPPVPRENKSEILSYRRVDLTLYAPPGNPLVCRTNRGLVEAKGLKSDVDALSRTGEIVVRTSGSIKAVSERGKIIGWFKDIDHFGRSYFETKTGDIKIFISPRADLSVAIETSGFIASDYSMAVRPAGRIREKSAVATVGGGLVEMKVKSVLGDVQLVRIIE